eukprot:76972_1
MSTEPQTNKITKYLINLNWDTLQSFPFQSFLFLTNNNELMALGYTNGFNIPIHKFDSHKNEWIKIFDYNTATLHIPSLPPETLKIISAAYDDEHNLLYVCTLSRMITLDLQTKNKVTSNTPRHFGRFELIFVENKLHQIWNNSHYGTAKPGDHYVYDTTKRFHKITTFQPFDGLWGYRLVYLESQKCILSFGGFHENAYYCQNSIYRFSCV